MGLSDRILAVHEEDLGEINEFANESYRKRGLVMKRYCLSTGKIGSVGPFILYNFLAYLIISRYVIFFVLVELILQVL